MTTIQLDPATLARYDKPGPRYTSYPTAVEFNEYFTAADYASRLRLLGPEQCISLYMHLPFCQERCDFCGCYVVATRKREVGARYLQYLEEEMKLVRSHLPARPAVIQYHWGGGTPTYFDPDQLRQLNETVRKYFAILPDAERAIEIDPRVTTREHIDLLAELGFNRLSMGVQDFDPEVQRAIGRHQTEDQTRSLYDYCRDKGFKSINIDLVYGLPAQTPDSFSRTLASVLMLRPNRLALYSYAHVPWVRGNQKRIDTDLLPNRDEKLEIFARAARSFSTSGYRQIGMDHFALPEDELSQALDSGSLHRNFMGYTVHRTPNMIGLGLSAIGEVYNAYAQNVKKISDYYAAIDAGNLPIEKGYSLNRDDRIRRHVITTLMCNGHLSFAEVDRTFGIRFSDYFQQELVDLSGDTVGSDLLEISTSGLQATPLGQIFIRNISMVFDRYLREKQRDKPMFSRTV
jgi:oxygen-independent coproporphyrinogen III oxidase